MRGQARSRILCQRHLARPQHDLSRRFRLAFRGHRLFESQNRGHRAYEMGGEYACRVPVTVEGKAALVE